MDNVLLGLNKSNFNYDVKKWEDEIKRLNEMSKEHAEAFLYEKDKETKKEIYNSLKNINHKREKLRDAVRLAKSRMGEKVVSFPEKAPWAGF